MNLLPDPYTKVHQRIIEILKSSPPIKTVGIKNIIDITEDQWNSVDPIKREVNAGDLPEIVVMAPNRFVWDFFTDSRTAKNVWTYVIGVTTETLRSGGENNNQFQNITVNTVLWALMVTLSGQGNDTFGLDGLVAGYRARGMSSREAKEWLARGSDRWTALVAIDVDLVWSRAYIESLMR